MVAQNRCGAKDHPMNDNEKPREPAWITKLAQIVPMVSTRAHREQRLGGGSSGAASAARHIVAWRCACGWQGETRELKIGAGGVICPICRESSGLSAK
jgi:hypothetical protein